MFIIEL
jgi:alkanesulfonate monooxygenase SsuD/methylene tetrahydromethanopterin reductase-like flavin-dependent oxidoreductase (luciferase family)